jgi:hypothetical protein
MIKIKDYKIDFIFFLKAHQQKLQIRETRVTPELTTRSLTL